MRSLRLDGVCVCLGENALTQSDVAPTPYKASNNHPPIFLLTVAITAIHSIGGLYAGGLPENLVHLFPHVLTARRLQIPHGALHIGVPEPILDCPQINPGP